MADLRELAVGSGFRAPRTYIQSGNLVLEASGSAGVVESKLEKGLASRFGFDVDVVVRTADAWSAMLGTNPFRAASESEGNRVMMLVSKGIPRSEAAKELLERAVDGEQVAAAEGAVWIYYAAGAGKSKLSPSLVDRLVGSKVTARNWRTVVQLRELAAAKP